MAVGTNETNTYRRTQRKNTVFRSANQYSRTQPITCRKRRFLNCRGAVGRLKNGFSAIHTDTIFSILDDNICGMIHFSEWLSILVNIGIQVNTTGGLKQAFLTHMDDKEVESVSILTFINIIRFVGNL